MRSDDLFDAIGEVKDEYINDAGKAKKNKLPRWAKWSSAIAACLAIVLAIRLLFPIGVAPGSHTGGSGDSDLVYTNYTGPVLPLTIQGNPAGISATREITFDFSPYYSTTASFEIASGELQYYDSYDSAIIVTDTYLLQNTTGEDQAVTLLYPYVGSMWDQNAYPNITVDGQAVSSVLYPGPYTGSFTGVWGSEEEGSVNLAPLTSFDDYQALLSDGSYLHSAFDEFPSLDIPVTVYRLHDYVYSKTTEDVNPTLSMDFFIDYDKTYVLSYGMDGASWDLESGFCAKRKSAIAYRPNIAEDFQYPDDGYVILLGEDLESYTIQGYKNGSCKEGEELEDLSCTVTRYECTLGEILSYLLDHYMGEPFISDNMDNSYVPPMELYYHLTAELLYTYGCLGDTPVERYDSGSLEDIFHGVSSNGRVLYFAFDVAIPAGESISVTASMLRDESCDYWGDEQNRDGYDMATQLGSNLTFTQQLASITGFEEIEILGQNFGFDPTNGITEVTLDPNVPHYWIEVRKCSTE